MEASEIPRLARSHLDSRVMQRHLATQGFATLLTDIARAAVSSRAPFLEQDVTLAAARSQWSQAFEVVTRMAALEDAVASAKSNLAERSDMAALQRLKAERDNLKHAIKSGSLWSDGAA